MKLIIFSGLFLCTIAAPTEIYSNNDKVTKDNLRQLTVAQQQNKLIKRQITYPAPAFGLNFGKDNSQEHRNARLAFTEDRDSRNIKQHYQRGEHSISYYEDQNISPTATPFETQDSQLVSQHKQYIPRSQQQAETVHRYQFELQPDSVSSQPISYKPPVPDRQYIAINNLQQQGSQPVNAVSQNYLQVVTPGPRSFIQNKPETDKAKNSASGRQLLSDAHFILKEEFQPLNLYSESLLPNFLQIQGEFSPHTQTLAQPNFLNSFENILKNNHHPLVNTANVFYTTNNVPFENFRSGLPSNYGDRQIIPAPQEFLNTALTIGNNIVERIPGYKLTSHLVGLLGNVTRLGVNFINTQFPLINPALLNPNQIDVYPNRPVIIPSNDYDHRPTPPTYTTTTTPPPPPPIVNSAEENSATDTHSSNEHRDDPNQADDFRNSQENNYNSQQQEYYENPQTSQEHHYDSQENVHASQYSQEDQRQANPENHDIPIPENQEVSKERVDYNMPAVADDIVPEDEFGIGEDDDKIDTKAITSIVG